MKLVKKLALIALIGIYGIAYAQNTDQVKKKGPDDTYARSSVSYLLLDFSNEKYSSMLKQAMNNTKLPDKFDNNNLKKKVIPSPYYRSAEFTMDAKNAENVRNALIAENYAIDVVKYWWKIKEDGSYSTKLIEERGEYNASDFDYQQAMASKVGRAKIGDQGLKLIGNSYVMVLDYHHIQTQEEIYDAQDKAARETAEKNKTEFKPVKRTKNGYIGKITAYLFKINYTDTVQGYFDAAFIDDKKIDLSKLNNIFSEVYSPVKLITVENQPAEGTQPNPGEFLAPPVQKSNDELMAVLVNNGITKTLDRIEKRVEEFRVKTPVTNINPIRAKIGKKESLTHERRYFVWQYVSNSNNEVIAKKKGVIRARKVMDNRQDELGNTKESSFYQVAGGGISEGMTLQEAKDLGFGIGAGFGSAGFVAHLDMNVGQFLNIPLKQFKLYGDIGFASPELEPIVSLTNSTTFPSEATDFSSLRFAVGIQKEYPFMRNFLFGWYLGYGGETLTWEIPEGDTDLKEDLSAGGVQLGGKFGINVLSSSLQLLASFNYHGYGNVSYHYTPEDGEEQTEDLGVGWTDIFKEKSPISFDISLRLNF